MDFALFWSGLGWDGISQRCLLTGGGSLVMLGRVDGIHDIGRSMPKHWPPLVKLSSLDPGSGL